MNGDGMLAAQFFTPAHVGNGNYNVGGVGDFNGDEQPDLIFQHADGTLAAWLMTGNKLNQAVLLSPENPGHPGWRVAGIPDLDRNGKSDLLFQHKDGTLAVWFMEGIRLRDAALLDPAHPGDKNWRVVGTGEFNSDGRDDLLFQHADGRLAVWEMSGAKLQQPRLLSRHHPGDSLWQVVSVVDLNRDGKSDLVFRHLGSEDLAVWFMDGPKLGSTSHLNPRNAGGTWKIVAPR